MGATIFCVWTEQEEFEREEGRLATEQNSSVAWCGGGGTLGMSFCRRAEVELGRAFSAMSWPWQSTHTRMTDVLDGADVGE